jgi:hypothetical protein
MIATILTLAALFVVPSAHGQMVETVGGVSVATNVFWECRDSDGKCRAQSSHDAAVPLQGVLGFNAPSYTELSCFTPDASQGSPTTCYNTGYWTSNPCGLAWGETHLLSGGSSYHEDVENENC